MIVNAGAHYSNRRKVVRAVFNSRERRGWETIGAQCTIRIPGQPSHGTARCAPEPLAGRISPLRGPRAAGRPLQHPRKRRPRRDFASRLAVCATALPLSWNRSQVSVFDIRPERATTTQASSRPGAARRSTGGLMLLSWLLVLPFQ